MALDRRRFLSYVSAIGLSGTLFPGVLYGEIEEGAPITVETIAAAEELAGLSFTDEERELMVDDLRENLEGYEAVRDLRLPNEVPPALVFDPSIPGDTPPSDDSIRWELPEIRPLPAEEDLAFASIGELAALLRAREVTSTELTELALSRLQRFDDRLQAVVTFTIDRAMEKAARADEELDRGEWRGPLHGIPYGAKDLFAVAGYPTTWGAEPYRTQHIDETAAVVERLDDAGAVLVAKLTLGALAWGDVWFDGQTKTPWNPEQGASGSSAGSGAAVAAGLVPFALGTETLGSIISPSTRNGITGHRPTFGTVSRHGAMALSWSMDKVGPMARSAEDCALIYDAIRGRDPRDPSTRESTFPFDVGRSPADLRVGYLAEAFERDGPGAEEDRRVLSVLQDAGLDLDPIQLPTDYPVGAMLETLNVEAAAAFDELTRTRGIDEMVRQGENTWPHVFRTARFVPAVEYVQVSRARTELTHAVHEVLDGSNGFVAPSFHGGALAITNLTGHPCVSVPNRFDQVDGSPGYRQAGSITFFGNLYRDDAALELAHLYQQQTDFHRRRPPVS